MSLQLPRHLAKPQRETPPLATLQIDCDAAEIDYERFWQSTGFSAAALTTRADMRQTLALCGGMAHGGFRYIRPHYLLNLVVVPRLEQPSYDWSRLDQALDAYLHQGLRPIFEIMGYPATAPDSTGDYGEKFQAMKELPPTCFDNLEDPAQQRAWYELVRALAAHLQERYGNEELRRWWFETWNEPDIGFWRWSHQAFLAYWDACSEGLRAVDPQLRFGGPGNHVAWSEHLWQTLEHCRSGRNAITGAIGSRIDFISIHCKGPADHVKDGERQELETRHAIAERFPEFAHLPFFNNECDPVTGWSRELWWHAGAYYPAWVARSTARALAPDFACARPRYAIMSSDNTFMGSFGQRTLHHRFADERFQRVSLVKKPIHNGMTLINRLRGPAVPVTVPPSCADRIAVATTVSSDQVAILLSNLLKFEAEEFHNNTISPTVSQVERMLASQVQLELDCTDIPLRDPWLIHYRIDDTQPGAFDIWRSCGQPERPSHAELDRMRQHQELLLVDDPLHLDAADGRLRCRIHLPCPAVSLLLLLERPADPPPAPDELELERYIGIDAREERFLRWRHDAQTHVRAFQVLFVPADGTAARIVSPPDAVDTVLVHSVVPDQPGDYRVRAVDFWARASPWSPPLASA
ncbi:MAG: GH39 family glycosyl hydrolase [Planctomycetota bacterium]